MIINETENCIRQDTRNPRRSRRGRGKLEKNNIVFEFTMMDYISVILGPMVFFYFIDHIFGFGHLTYHWLIYAAYIINKLANISFVVGFVKEFK